MKVETVKYYCDVCHKEVKDEKDFKLIQIPVDYLQEGKILTSNIKFSVCDECNEFLKNIIKENFAYITNTWCCGVQVEEVKDEEVK